MPDFPTKKEKAFDTATVGVPSYVRWDHGSKTVIVDGSYTVDDLRRIADALEEATK